MPTKSFNPITKSRRYITVLDYSELTRTTPQKSLTKGKKSTGGRNSAGRITTRFRGNGNKSRYNMRGMGGYFANNNRFMLFANSHRTYHHCSSTLHHDLADSRDTNTHMCHSCIFHYCFNICKV